VRATSSYGHTPGHTIYTVESKGKKLVLIGDLIHVGAVQFDHPEVTIGFDSDAKNAAAARAKVFQAAARKVRWWAPATCPSGPGPSAHGGKGYQWVPVSYTQLR
jgi:glyoxylase-like metal-dependent hydrolase (beta-lactamase superfamily II)